MKKLIIIAALTSLTVMANAQANRTYTFTPSALGDPIEFGNPQQQWGLTGNQLIARTVINMNKYVYATGTLVSTVVVNGFGSNPSPLDSSSTASIFLTAKSI